MPLPECQIFEADLVFLGETPRIVFGVENIGFKTFCMKYKTQDDFCNKTNKENMHHFLQLNKQQTLNPLCSN